MDLNLLRAFAAVHESGSFSGAATRLGVPRSTVSRAVASLEASLGITLFHRTTRKVTTSREGLSLYGRVSAPLGELERSMLDAPEAEETPSGVLRITTTVDLGTVLLAEVVARYVARYPDVSVQMHLSPSLVDLVAEGFDLALRVHPGRRRGTALVGRKVGEVVLSLFASPGYVARRGEVQRAEDLATHDVVLFQGAPPLRAGAKVERTRTGLIAPRVRVTSEDMFFCREVIRQGGGVGVLPTFLADSDVAAGRLVRVLPRWVVYTGSAYLVQPSRKHVPRRVTAFRDLLLEMFRQRPMS